MAICPWGALGGGKFKTKEQLEKKDGRQMGGPSEKHLKVAAVLEKIAKAKGTIITSVAMAYVMHQSPDVYPIGMSGHRLCARAANANAGQLVDETWSTSRATLRL